MLKHLLPMIYYGSIKDFGVLEETQGNSATKVDMPNPYSSGKSKKLKGKRKKRDKSDLLNKKRSS